MTMGRVMTRMKMRPAPVLAAAAALLFAATMPGAADERPGAADERPGAAWSGLAGPSLADEFRPAAPERRLPVIGLRLPAAPVGLAFELADGMHLGAAGNFDPAGDEAVGLIAFRLSL